MSRRMKYLFIGIFAGIMSLMLTGCPWITSHHQVAAPDFSPPAGSYADTTTVTISTTTEGASIRYTTDGSEPTSTTGTVYTSPVIISSSLTLKAVASKQGMLDSEVAVAVYAISATPPITEATWSVVRQAEWETHFIDVCFADADNGWAVGWNNVIAHTSNGGADWTLQSTPDIPWGRRFYSVYFRDAQNGWAVGDGIAHTTNGGATWNDSTSPGSIGSYLQGVDFPDDTHGWAVGGWNGTILSTADGGITWAVQNDGVDSVLRDVDFVSPTTGWAVGSNDVILYTTNGGTSWTPQAHPPCGTIYNVCFISPTEGWAAGSDLLYTNDAGATWAVKSPSSFAGIEFLDANEGWGTSCAFVFHTIDGGATWVYAGTPVDRGNDLKKFDAVAPDLLWIAGTGGLIVHSDDGGLNWTVQTQLEFNDIGALFFLNDNEGWIGLWRGPILRTVDAGAAWTSQDSQTDADIRSIYFLDSNTGWATGGYVMLHTTDGGISWISQTLPAGTSYLDSVYFADENEGWASGENGKIIHTTDGGQTWSHQTSNSTQWLMDMQFVSPAEGWAVGDERHLLHTTNGGGTWSLSTMGTPGDRLNGVYFIDATRGWIVGSGSNGAVSLVFQTTDGGASWTRLSDGPGNVMEDIWFADQSEGYATSSTGIVHTSDGGSTWTAQDTGTGEMLWAISHAPGGKYLWVGGQFGLVLRAELPAP